MISTLLLAAFDDMDILGPLQSPKELHWNHVRASPIQRGAPEFISECHGD